MGFKLLFIGNGENCIGTENDAKITLNNVSSDVQLVNDSISLEILEVKEVVYGEDAVITFKANKYYKKATKKVKIKIK